MNNKNTESTKYEYRIVNIDKNSDQGNEVVNRYVFNRDLNELVN